VADGSSPADAAAEPSCGPPGTLDTAFANGGLLVAESPKALTSESIAATSDGADGVYIGFSPSDMAIPDSTTSASLSAVHVGGSGNIDASFGTAGRVDATFPNVLSLIGITRGAVSGAIYLHGVSAEQSGPSTVDSDTLVRLTPTGAIDKSFGGDGHVQLGGPSGLATNGYVDDLVERSDGSILIVTDSGFVHLSATGSELGSTLISVIPYAQDSENLHFLPAAGDSVVIVGSWSAPLGQQASANPTVARFTAALALDTTFGNQGQVVSTIGGGATLFPHAGRADFGIFLGGGTQIASLDASGSPVQGFGSRGLATVGNAVVASLARSDGSVVYVASPNPGDASIVAGALTTSGAVDATFGASGSLNVPKSITRTDPNNTKVGAEYVGPEALIAAGTRRAYLVSTYGSNEDDGGGNAFYGVYLARFCVE
jgi:hypothetical protein